MRIVNFNAPSKYWIAWNKTYCYDLDRKITSLFDYLIYFNPDYTIFNSPHSETPWDDETLRSKGYLVEEGNKAYFLVGGLQWRQGLYNNSIYGDASLVFGAQWAESQEAKNNKEVIATRNIAKWTSCSVTLDEVTYLGPKEYFFLDDDEGYVVLNGFIPGQDRIEKKYICKNSVGDWEIRELHDSQIIGNNTIQVDTPDTNFFFYTTPFRSFPKFPSGYCCICNKQNPMSAEDFMILPIGNGGFYSLLPNASSLVATFQKNELGNFSNSLSFNLGSNLRYFANSLRFNTGLPNQSGKGVIQIGDQHDNLWTGTKDLVSNITYQNTQEEVFFDMKIEHNSAVVEYQNVSTLTLIVDSEPKIPLNKDIF